MREWDELRIFSEAWSRIDGRKMKESESLGNMQMRL